jgi:hypothetical protein
MNTSVFRASDSALDDVQINAPSYETKILDHDRVSPVPTFFMDLTASRTNKRLVFIGDDLYVNLSLSLG